MHCWFRPGAVIRRTANESPPLSHLLGRYFETILGWRDVLYWLDWLFMRYVYFPKLAAHASVTTRRYRASAIANVTSFRKLAAPVPGNRNGLVPCRRQV